MCAVESFGRLRRSARAIIRSLVPLLAGMYTANYAPAAAQTSPLVAGAGRELIQSYVGDPIGVWSQTQKDSWGFDRASATALFLSDGVESVTIVTVDTLLIYEYQTEYVKTKLRAQGKLDNLFLIASHTHATPSVLSAGDAVDMRIRNAILSAVLKAQSAARPAKIGGGEGYYIAAFNRIPRSTTPTKVVYSICLKDLLNDWRVKHPNDPVDDQVAVLRILGMDDAPIATLFNYAAHPVTFGGDENFWGTPGYPAQARRVVERNLGGLSLFVQGFGGDIDTPCAGPIYAPDPSLSGTLSQLAMMRFGAGLGSVVISITKNIDHFETDIPIGISINRLSYINLCSKWGSAPSLLIGAISLGRKAVLVGVSAEPFTLIGNAIRNVLKNRHGYEFNITAGYMNSAIGYIPDEAVWGTGAYSTIPVPGKQVMCVPRDTAKRVQTEVYRQVDALASN